MRPVRRVEPLPWRAVMASKPLTPPNGSRLSILTVHAHPDDEASKGAGTVARYVAEGAEATLVCCTGGEEGDILNKVHGSAGDPGRPVRSPQT